jgi:hypothetical protein
MIKSKPINPSNSEDNDLYGGSSIFNSDLTDFDANKTAPLKRNRLLLTKKVMKHLQELQSK